MSSNSYQCPNWEPDEHRGMISFLIFWNTISIKTAHLDPFSTFSTTGATGSCGSARAALWSAGRADGTAWLLSLASSIFIVSLIPRLLRALSRRVEAFLHTAGFTSKQQQSNTASRTGRWRQTEFLIDQTFTSSHCDGCAEQKSASPRRRHSAGWRALIRVSLRRLTETQIILNNNIRLSTADQLEHFLFYLLRLNLQLPGCQP